MRFLAIIATILTVVGFGMASAIPANELVARNTTTANDYGTICNSASLQLADIEGCYDFLNAPERADLDCWSEGPDSDGHFCSNNGVYVTGVSWPNRGVQLATKCGMAAGRLWQLLGTCGLNGGSIGVMGNTTPDLVIHLTDHWV
ncbi:hypothetical protein BT63DRAFT_85672 [Microthyrium microscopicum]|uniref:Cyanovirin-N domain-containing protein n=1 Tax=Microthyrium microscopicum TaxID=703497 RepID=A0A6A6U2E9_9PEZI|nr:hypothetical protein BT63DRAFT_85672 [Microthyrium microscopicum]